MEKEKKGEGTKRLANPKNIKDLFKDRGDDVNS